MVASLLTAIRFQENSVRNHNRWNKAPNDRDIIHADAAGMLLHIHVLVNRKLTYNLFYHEVQLLTALALGLSISKCRSRHETDLAVSGVPFFFFLIFFFHFQWNRYDQHRQQVYCQSKPPAFS